MRTVLFLVFVTLFVAIVVCTMLAVFAGVGSPSDAERALFVKGFMVEIGGAIIALWYSLWGLRRPRPQDGEAASVTTVAKAQALAPIAVPPLPRKLRFFVTTPLAGIGTQEQYDAFMAEMIPVITAIRSIDSVDSVYYFNEHVPTIDYHFKDKWNVPDYINRLDQADYVIVILNSSTVSAVYFEAGYALGRGIKAIHFVGPHAKIPQLMKQCAFVYPKSVRHETFASLDQIPELLRHVMPVLQYEEPNQHLDPATDLREVS